ncbi:MAG: hypothetical protein JXR37_25630 [Kiritimatiellae bacterium]|nr:hypothetical protein [Kiritimatiellia bacterium]
MKKAEKRKRAVWSAAAVAGVALVLAGVHQVIGPLVARNNARLEDLTALRMKLAFLEHEIKVEQRAAVRNPNAPVHLADISRRYVPQPMFDNYEITIKRLLDRYARAAGVTIEEFVRGELKPLAPGMEQARQRHPRFGADSSAPSWQPSFRFYAATMELRCGYAALMRFVQILEQDNPYLSLSDLNMVPDWPRKHRVTLTVSWPVWIDGARRKAVEGRGA